MATAYDRAFRIYAFIIRIPVIGAIVRLPFRAFRAVVLGVLRDEMTHLQPSGSNQGGGALAPAVGALWDAVSNLQAQMKSFAHRIEFTRAETLFEMRAMLNGNGGKLGGHVSEKARVKNENKVATAKSAGILRLNIGCGHLPLEDYINVDGRDLPGVDIVADASSLPLEPLSVSEIFSAHMLEHFPLEDFRRKLLPYWSNLLRSGGKLRAVVPDPEAMIEDYVAGKMSFEDLREVTYGLQEYEGDFHYNMFSREMLKRLIEEVGLCDVSFEYIGRKNGKCREMAIAARKP